MDGQTGNLMDGQKSDVMDGWKDGRTGHPTKVKSMRRTFRRGVVMDSGESVGRIDVVLEAVSHRGRRTATYPSY